MSNQLNYKEMMALRCAYNHGVRTPETRAAACLYVKLGRAKLLDKFKKDSEEKNTSNSSCQHGYDIACLICGFGTVNGERIYRNMGKKA